MKNTYENIIEGKSIGLFKSLTDDAEFITGHEKENYPFVSYNPPDEQIAMMSDPHFIHMTIRRLVGLEMIGHIIIRGLDDPHKTIEFKRIVIYEKGSGFGREVLGLLKQLCFEKLGAHRLWLDVYEENQRAIKLYESEGFIHEGTLRDSFKDHMGYRSQRIYSMLESDYLKLLG